ncbi:MAG: mechanosensitive ion channel family protein [Rhodothermales bacterium]
MQELLAFLDAYISDTRLQAGIVVVLSFFVAKVSDLFFTRLIRTWTSRTKSEIDDQVIDVLHKPVFRTVALLGFMLALNILGPAEGMLNTGRHVIHTLIILIWLVTALRLSKTLITSMSGNKKRFMLVQAATVPLFDIAAKVFIFALGSYLILISWEINISGWLASAGIVGLGIGLAAQDTFANLFAGLSILADSPYKIGDFIVLDSTERGKVTRIGLRSTRVLTNDMIEVTIPNSIIANSKIVNESGGPSMKQRLRVPIGVAYGVKIDDVERALLAVAANEERLSLNPAPTVHFQSFGDFSLNFELRCWIEDPAIREPVMNHLNRSMYEHLNEAGIEIPFPKQDVYIKEMPKA